MEYRWNSNENGSFSKMNSRPTMEKEVKMNDFVLRQYAAEKSLLRTETPMDIQFMIRDICAIEPYEPEVWNYDEDDVMTTRAKKNWLRTLLTGAVQVKANSDEDGEFLALESLTPHPLIQWLPLFGTCYGRTQDVFYAVREAMRDECPELLTEIAQEEYERVWPGWTEGLDMIHVVMRAEGSFWEPLITEALEKWGGYHVRRTKEKSSITEFAARMALQGLLSFGKTGECGVSEEVLMAMIGTTLPSLPELINIEEGQVRDSKQSKLESGNGDDATSVTVSETGSIWYDFTGEMVGYTKFSMFDDVPYIDFPAYRSSQRMRAIQTERNNNRYNYNE